MVPGGELIGVPVACLDDCLFHDPVVVLPFLGIIFSGHPYLIADQCPLLIQRSALQHDVVFVASEDCFSRAVLLWSNVRREPDMLEFCAQ